MSNDIIEVNWERFKIGAFSSRPIFPGPQLDSEDS